MVYIRNVFYLLQPNCWYIGGIPAILLTILENIFGDSEHK